MMASSHRGASAAAWRCKFCFFQKEGMNTAPKFCPECGKSQIEESGQLPSCESCGQKVASAGMKVCLSCAFKQTAQPTQNTSMDRAKAIAGEHQGVSNPPLVPPHQASPTTYFSLPPQQAQQLNPSLAMPPASQGFVADPAQVQPNPYWSQQPPAELFHLLSMWQQQQTAGVSPQPFSQFNQPIPVQNWQEGGALGNPQKQQGASFVPSPVQPVLASQPRTPPLPAQAQTPVQTLEQTQPLAVPAPTQPPPGIASPLQNTQPQSSQSQNHETEARKGVSGHQGLNQPTGQTRTPPPKKKGQDGNSKKLQPTSQDPLGGNRLPGIGDPAKPKAGSKPDRPLTSTKDLKLTGSQKEKAPKSSTVNQQWNTPSYANAATKKLGTPPSTTTKSENVSDNPCEISRTVFR